MVEAVSAHIDFSRSPPVLPLAGFNREGRRSLPTPAPAGLVSRLRQLHDGDHERYRRDHQHCRFVVAHINHLPRGPGLERIDLPNRSWPSTAIIHRPARLARYLRSLFRDRTVAYTPRGTGMMRAARRPQLWHLRRGASAAASRTNPSGPNRAASVRASTVTIVMPRVWQAELANRAPKPAGTGDARLRRAHAADGPRCVRVLGRCYRPLPPIKGQITPGIGGYHSRRHWELWHGWRRSRQGSTVSPKMLRIWFPHRPLARSLRAP